MPSSLQRAVRLKLGWPLFNVQNDRAEIERLKLLRAKAMKKLAKVTRRPMPPHSRVQLRRCGAGVL